MSELTDTKLQELAAEARRESDREESELRLADILPDSIDTRNNQINTHTGQ